MAIDDPLSDAVKATVKKQVRLGLVGRVEICDLQYYPAAFALPSLSDASRLLC